MQIFCSIFTQPLNIFLETKKKKTFRVSEEDGKNMLSFLEVA